MQGSQGKSSIKSSRKRAVVSRYVSPNQMVLEGFETPFEQKLTKTNRWVKLGKLIPWDRVVEPYNQLFQSKEGRPPLSGRLVIGAVIIKHSLNLTDRETIRQIQENMFMQYFLGYSTFSNEEPFSHTMFVSIRERLTTEILEQVNEIILSHHGLMQSESPTSMEEDNREENKDEDQQGSGGILETDSISSASTLKTGEPAPLTHKGSLLIDATVCPQTITYPTDIKLLNASRVKTEELIDRLYQPSIHGTKPRTYRKIARKEFLKIAQKKRKSYQEYYQGRAKQMSYLHRNIKHIDKMLLQYEQSSVSRSVPFNKTDLDYLATVKKVYAQQYYMHQNKVNTVPDRIVNIHQPHVRPIVRGKEGKKVEFGSKIQLSLVDGYSMIDHLSWDNFNEGGSLQSSVQQYRRRYGFYPKEVLADKIYCTRENRAFLKAHQIHLKAKPLGRPKSVEATLNRVSPGERNPIEGKFGQAKLGYGMGAIRARLKATSESWICSIILVLNLEKLSRRVLLWMKNLILSFFYRLNFVRFSV